MLGCEVKRDNTHFVGALRAKFNKPCIGAICCQRRNIHDIMRETAVPKYFGVISHKRNETRILGTVRRRVTKHILFWGNGVEGTPFWGGAEGAKILVVCGSGAENNSVQTLSCAVSLCKDKASDAQQ